MKKKVFCLFFVVMMCAGLAGESWANKDNGPAEMDEIVHGAEIDACTEGLIPSTNGAARAIQKTGPTLLAETPWQKRRNQEAPALDADVGIHLERIRSEVSSAEGTSRETAGSATKWTFLFYDDADFNNGYDPFNDFAADAYSGPNLDVIVLRDRNDGPAQYYYIDEDHTPILMEELGEVDMGDYATLRDFLNYGMTNYPADRYLLTVYDHGGGWRGACLDDTDGGWLTMDGFQQAFVESGPIDIICFTAPCLMGAFESVYELRDHVDIYIGSEEMSGYVYWWNILDDVCAMLIETPDWTNVDISREIIRLVDENDPGFDTSHLTMSATQTAGIVVAAQAIDTLGANLQAVLGEHPDDIALSRGMAKDYLTYFDQYLGDLYSVIDIYDLAERLEQMVDDPTIRQDAAALKTALDEIIVASCHGELQEGSHGLTLFYPRLHDFYTDTYRNSDLDFADQYSWPEYLQAYFDYEPAPGLVTGPGPDTANPPLARTFDPENPLQFLTQWSAYGVDKYGVNVAIADPYGGGTDMIITGAGPGQVFGPHVRAFSAAGTPVPGINYLAYGTNKYGVNLAAGDIDGDRFDEIVTGAGPGAVFGPHVRGWNFDRSAIAAIPQVSYFAYGTNRWGVNVCCGDIDGDEIDEIVTGAGPGAVYGPHVRGWNVDGGSATSIPGVNFFAYGTPKYGVNVTCGDIDGDGIDEIVTGSGPGAVFGPHVRGWNVDGGSVTAMANFSFFAWPAEELRYGAKVFSGADLYGNGRDEIVVGQGPDPEAGTWVKVYMYDGSQEIEWISLEAFGDMELTHGATVAAGRF